MPRPRQSRPADPLQRCRQHHHRTRSLRRFGERISSSRSCLRLSFFSFFYLNLARTSGHIFHHAEDIHVEVVKQAHMLT